MAYYTPVFSHVNAPKSAKKRPEISNFLTINTILIQRNDKFVFFGVVVYFIKISLRKNENLLIVS